jgi:hypothetical protein
MIINEQPLFFFDVKQNNSTSNTTTIRSSSAFFESTQCASLFLTTLDLPKTSNFERHNNIAII